MENDLQTFLIPRPFWVNDVDQTHCHSCNNAFGPLRRRVRGLLHVHFTLYSRHADTCLFLCLAPLQTMVS